MRQSFMSWILCIYFNLFIFFNVLFWTVIYHNSLWVETSGTIILLLSFKPSLFFFFPFLPLSTPPVNSHVLAIFAECFPSVLTQPCSLSQNDRQGVWPTDDRSKKKTRTGERETFFLVMPQSQMSCSFVLATTQLVLLRKATSVLKGDGRACERWRGSVIGWIRGHSGWKSPLESSIWTSQSW